MNNLMMRGAGALALLLCAPAVCAQDISDADSAENGADISVTGVRPDGHGPAGTMADHVHKAGDVMVGAMVMHEVWGGTNRQGTTDLIPTQIAEAGYAVRDSAMTMDMVMLHLMWAPSDRVTFMVMPTWMRMGMTMEGLPMVAGGTMAAMTTTAHTLAPGETMSHSVEGVGDTQFGALLSLSRNPGLSAHAGLMVSAPTGDVTRKNADGTYVHYMMQGGSGTWDLIPSLTVHGMTERLGWGAQASYVWRTEAENAAGFSFGDRFAATAWLSHPVTDRLSVSGRLSFTSEGAINGHYNGAHKHMSPPDRQANYGGERMEAGLGANLIVGDRLRLGVEALLPTYQNLNGIQLPKRASLNASASMMF